MEPRDGYIEGVPCWCDSDQPDPEAAKEFYGELFGWEFEDVSSPEAPAPYHIGRLPGGDVGAIGGIPEGSPQVARWNTYIWVDNVDNTTKKAVEAGGSVVAEPMDVGQDGRMSIVSDPEGAVFSLWEPKDHKGSQVVNAPGSVNFNDLNVRDIDTAKSFYGSVFGWDTMAMGDTDAFWVLPAYGDHLEELNPGFRESMAEMGVPGFENVVASLNQIPEEQGDTPPHWGITFAVEEADKAAERATELGGSVVVPPFDTPWVRATVISDPQGAVFTASQYAPENQ